MSFSPVAPEPGMAGSLAWGDPEPSGCLVLVSPVPPLVQAARLNIKAELSKRPVARFHKVFIVSFLLPEIRYGWFEY